MNQIMNCGTVSHYTAECFMPKCHSDIDHNSDLKMRLLHVTNHRNYYFHDKIHKNNAAASSKLSVCAYILYYINIFYISSFNALIYIYIYIYIYCK